MLFGLNDIADQPEIILVEGEMDKLALEEAGFFNVASVPDGAPKVSSMSSWGQAGTCLSDQGSCDIRSSRACQCVLAILSLEACFLVCCFNICIACML